MHQPTRPSFTVTIENYENPQAERREIAYDADMLTVVSIPEDRSYGLMFLCSGEPKVVPARYIKSVAFAEDGATWCPRCDAPVPGFLPKEAAA